MKIKIPGKTVEACDLCKCASTWLTKCKVCACEYCHTCEAIICGCVHQPDICKECADKAKVRAVVEKFVKPISALLKKRDTAMRRAGQNVESSESERLRCADLFCGAGGAAVGLHRAGFDVEGWDIKPQKNFPLVFHLGDAMDADLTGFDFAWASPPCQAHTTLKHVTGKEYECYIARTREKLKAWGGLYIIENVVGAPLENPVMLCGSSFGLRVRRHRLFESNIRLTVPACNHAAQPEPIDVSGTGAAQINDRKNKTGGKCRKPKNLDEAREIMGMPWATRKEIAQAIPPAFAEHLALQIMRELKAAND